MSPAGPGFCQVFQRALVLCAHTDDEFGCAGMVIRLLAQGTAVTYVALSRCEESVPQGLPRDILEHECRAATAELGIPPGNVDIDRFVVRELPASRQKILEKFVQINRSYKPQLVLMPSSHDIHQDHQVVYQEGLRAFKHTTILGYEMPQNIISFNNSAFVMLSDADLRRKISALSKYESQTFRPYSNAEFVESLARVRGLQCGATYAEAFELIRWIVP
jgi:LmbE family N-acetylglucosaminyl deacetylase